MIVDAIGDDASPSFGTATLDAALVIGTMGLMIAGVQPVLFGALIAAHRISTAQIGHIAAAELISVGIGVADAMLTCESLRVAATGALILLAALNLATILVDGTGVLIVRGLAGLPGGVLLWMATAVIVLSCPLLSGPTTMRVWIKEGTTSACEKA